MPTSLCGASNYSNTGGLDCDIQFGNPKMMLVGSATFSPSDYADQVTMDTAIIAKTKLATGNSQKLFPFPVIQGAADNTEAAKTATLGYGLTFKVVRSKPAYTFDVIAGSTLEKALIGFDGKTLPLFILDDQFNMAGVYDAAANFKGSQWQLGIEPRGMGDGTNVKTTKISISLIDSADFVENKVIYDSNLSTSLLAGLKDVVMSVLSNASNVYKIRFNIKTALLNTPLLNVYDQYGALLAPLTFIARTGINFATSLPITSIAIDATLSALTVTFDSTAWAALSSGAKIQLSAPLPATLDAANITGVEILTIIITKP